MTQQETFLTGTTAKCNRCGRYSPLPKSCTGHLESTTTVNGVVYRSYRLETMCALDCGHVDSHWVLAIQD